MSQGPFARRSTAVNAQPNRRRSTRLDRVIPILISGRDASSQPFREKTETIMVNVHGANFKTRNQILIGMHLTVENLLDGASEEAICIRVGEPEPGQDQHVIAIQLLKPRNIWGVKDPPPDWQYVVGPDITQMAPRQIATIGHRQQQGPSLPAAPPENADLEQQSTQITETALQHLRQQVDEVLHDSLKEFEDRLKVLEATVNARILEHSEKVRHDAESSLSESRREFLGQLSTRVEGAAVLAEKAMQDKIDELLSPLLHRSPVAHPEKKTDPDLPK